MSTYKSMYNSSSRCIAVESWYGDTEHRLQPAIHLNYYSF